MRNILHTLIFLCLSYSMHAQEFSMVEVESIAYSFFNEGPQYAPGIDGNHPTKQISSIEAISRDSTDYMYIVNAEDSAGWVIISNEQKYSHIIAHSDGGSFVYDEEELPPALVFLLNNHMNAIDSTRENNNGNTKKLERSIQTKMSPTFLSNNCWKQSMNNTFGSDCDKIYNKYCPEVKRDSCTDWFVEGHPKVRTCNRKLAGCGAIAMAQIMKYWQWPDYAEVNNSIYYYDWDNMPDTILNNTDMYQVNQVARLIENCRTAAQSIGACLWTATEISKIHDAMIEVFGYHSNLVRAKRENVDRASMIVNEIDLGRPVIVQAMGDSLLLEWHTFIVDGYRIGDFDDNGFVDTTFHVNFGWGNERDDHTYFDLTFNGYYFAHVYLIELYPECSFRANDVSLSNPLTITANANRTYYSTNNVTLCSNNNSITVENDGHLLVKAGNEVRLKPGFHAKAGSDVHIMINDTLCNTSQASAPQRIAPKTPLDDTNSTNESVTNNGLENTENEVIVSTSIYTISGQLIQSISGGQHDVAHLSNGMYILQHRMSDGSVRSEKRAKN